MGFNVGDRIVGTCIWFASRGQSFGYIGYGIFTNGMYESQIYAHYKNIKTENLRDGKFRELKANDIVSFEIGEGFHNPGTQALNIKIETYGDNNIGFEEMEKVPK